MNIKLRHIFVLLHNDMPGDSQVKDDVIHWRTGILGKKELRIPPIRVKPTTFQLGRGSLDGREFYKKQMRSLSKSVKQLQARKKFGRVPVVLLIVLYLILQKRSRAEYLEIMAEWIKTSTIEVSLFDCTGFDFRHSIENDLSVQGLHWEPVTNGLPPPIRLYHRLFSLRVRPYVWVSFNCPFSRTAAFYTIGGSCLWKKVIKKPLHWCFYC